MMHKCFTNLVGKPHAEYAYISPEDWQRRPAWYPNADGAGHYRMIDDWTRPIAYDGSYPSVRYERVSVCPVCGEQIRRTAWTRKKTTSFIV